MGFLSKIGAVDRQFDAANFRQSFEATDRRVAGIGFLLQVIQHLVAVVGTHWNQIFLPRGFTSLFLFGNRFDHRKHIDIATQMRGFVEAVGVLFPLGGAQMREVDAWAEALNHAG